MTKQRRQILIRAVEWGAVALILLDVVLYFVIARPLAEVAAAEQRERNRVQSRVREIQSRVERMEALQTSFPQTEEKLNLFLRNHVPPRRRGFSRAAGLVRRLTQESGLEVFNLSYRLESSRDAPLENLGIDVTVEGPLSSLLRFAHGLETAEDLVVIRDFTFQPGEGGGLALRVGADLYLTP